MPTLMTDETTDLKDQASTGGDEAGASFTERYSEVLSKVNETLDQVDWGQMGRIGKGVGVLPGAGRVDATLMRADDRPAAIRLNCDHLGTLASRQPPDCFHF